MDLLNNYNIDENGVIYQINKDPFIYDFNYTNKTYVCGPTPVDQMSCLRLGFIVSHLGFVPESILDVGYGNGSFLKIASGVIPNVYGFDVPPKFPVDSPKIKFLNSIYDRKVEVVTFFDSLEHFEDIYEIKLLKTNFIIISVPYCHYFSKKWFEEWKHRKPNEHLWHFNEKSLTNFFNAIGYEKVLLSNVEDVIRKPMDKYQNIITGIFRKC